MFKNSVFIIITIAGIFYNKIIFAQSAESSGWKEEDKIYSKVYDAHLLGNNLNSKTSLYQIIQQRPTILAMIFTRCSGICSPFLLQLKENLQLESGTKNLNIVVISFDPRDSIKDMNRYAKTFGLEDDKNWIFAITDSIQKLTQSIGFHPSWDSARQQFDHDAILVGINTDGLITKKLIGLRNEHEFNLLVSSVNNIFTPTYRIPTANSLFSCFNYNSKTGKNTPGLGLLFIALPAVIALLILIGANRMMRGARRDI